MAYNNRAGILGPMQIDPNTPQLPKQGGGGIFGMFQDDPGAVSGGDYSGRAPLTGQQKQGLIFSGISDAIDTLQGRNGDTTEGLSKQYAADYTKQKADARRTAVNAALQKAYAAGDMNAVRSAILSADPEDVSHIHDAITMTQPKLQDVGGRGFSIDPITNLPTEVIAAKNNPNEPFNANGTNNQAYQDYQVRLARARAQATADFRAPPKTKVAPGSTFGGNPASLFGGR